MKSSWSELCIALAGIVQASAQTEQLAKTGYLNTEEFTTSVKSLFVTSPENTVNVFGNLANIRHGLEILDKMITEYRSVPKSDVFRYTLGVMHIQKCLTRKQAVLGVIAERLEHAEAQSQHFGYTHDNLVSNIASIYGDTISKFQYRIQVTGNYNYLQQERVANQVRVLLLAGIRASMLWRQLGGSRLQFIMYRSHIADACHELLKEAKRQELTGGIAQE